MYRPLPDKLNYPELEQEILSFWEENSIFKSLFSIEKDLLFTAFMKDLLL